MDTFGAIANLIGKKVGESFHPMQPLERESLIKEIAALKLVEELLIDEWHVEANEMNAKLDNAIAAALFELDRDVVIGSNIHETRKSAKIHAIKAYRSVMSSGLPEAFAAVKKLRPDLFITKWSGE